MNQEDLGSATIPSTAEYGKVIPFPTQSRSETWSETQSEIAGITYVSATSPREWQTQQWLRKKFPWQRSPGGFATSDRTILDVAFSRISQSVQSEFQMSELSNCFDDWKDLLDKASRKVKGFESNHRKILGTLLALTKGKDIADFDTETLKIFREATNILRTPRTTKQDVKRIISGLLKRKKAMIPLGVDESDKDKVRMLVGMVDGLILKSRADR
jgi:hypothetical protein